MASTRYNTDYLIVKSIPRGATEQDVRAAFEEHYSIKEVHMIKHPYTHAFSGVARVHFETPEDVQRLVDSKAEVRVLDTVVNYAPGRPAPHGGGYRRDGGGSRGVGAHGGFRRRMRGGRGF